MFSVADNLFDDYTIGLAATGYAQGISSDDVNVRAINILREANPIDVYKLYGQQGLAEQQRINTAYEAASKPVPTRTVNEYLGDAGKAINQGLLLGAQGVSGLAETAVNSVRSAIDPNDYYGKVIHEIDSALGFTDKPYKKNSHTPLSQAINNVIGGIQESKSAPLQQRSERAADAYGLLQSERGEENPVQRFIGEIYDTAVTTGADSSLVIDKALQAGGSSVLPGGVGAAVVRKVGGTVGKKAAAGAAALTEGVIEGGVSASEAYKQVFETPVEELYNNSAEYKKLVDSGVPPKVAKDKIANSIALNTLLKVGAASSAVAVVGPKVETQIFSKTLRDAADKSPLGVTGNIIGQTIGEAAEESTQEILQTILSRQEYKRVDNDIDVFDGAGKAAVEGALGGAGLSGITNSPRAAGQATKGIAKVAGRAAAYAGQEIASITENAAAARTGANKIPTSSEAEPSVVQKVKEKVSEKVKEVSEKLNEDSEKLKKTKKPKKEVKAEDENPKLNKLQKKEQAKKIKRVETIKSAQLVYNKYKNKLKKPSVDLNKDLKPKAKKDMTEATTSINKIAEDFQVLIADNVGDIKLQTPAVQEELKTARRFLASDPVKKFIEIKDVLDLENDNTIKKVLDAIKESTPENENVSKVQRQALVEGFDYFDDRTQQHVRLHGLLQYARALDIAGKTKDGKYGYINGKVIPTRELWAQLGIFNRSHNAKARGVIRSVNQGNVDVKFNSKKPPIRINADDKSRALGEGIIKEANAINQFITDYRNKNGNGKKFEPTILELPEQPIKVEESTVYSNLETEGQGSNVTGDASTNKTDKPDSSPKRDTELGVRSNPSSVSLNEKSKKTTQLEESEGGLTSAPVSPTEVDFTDDLVAPLSQEGATTTKSNNKEVELYKAKADKTEGRAAEALNDKEVPTSTNASPPPRVSATQQSEESAVEVNPPGSTATATQNSNEEQISSAYNEGLSRLVRLDGNDKSMLEEVYHITQDPVSAETVDKLVSDKKSKIEAGAGEALIKGSGQFVQGLKEEMNRQLNAHTIRGRTILSRFYGLVNEGKFAISANGFGSLAFTELQEDGTAKYNDQLIEAALYGAFDWRLNSPSQSIYKEDIIANIFNIKETQVTSVHKEALQFGVTRKIALEGLARHVRGYTNLQDNSTRTRKELDSTIGDLAAEIYSTILDLGLLEEASFDVPLYDEKGEAVLNKEGKPVMTSVRTVKIQSERVSKFLDKVGGTNARKFSKLFNTRQENTFTIDGKIPRSELSKYQQDTKVKLTESNLDDVQKASDSPQYYNEEFGNFFLNFPRDIQEKLLGSREIRESTNKVHAINMAGLNLTNAGLLDLVGEIKESLTDYRNDLATAGGRLSELKDISVYFAHRMIKSGRIVQTQYGPTPNKIVRELFKNQPSTLDFNNKDDESAFWISIAVGLDLKIKRLNSNNILENIKDAGKEEIERKFNLTIPLLRDWLKTTNGINIKEIPENVTTALLTDLGLANQDPKKKLAEAPEFRELHTVFAYARYLNAEEAGTLSSFSHSLTIEVDGVTNGTINNLLYMMPSIGDAIKKGDLTELRKNLELVSKGGIFFKELGQGAKTLNEADESDIYEYSGERTAQDLNTFYDWSMNPGWVKASVSLLDALGVIESSIIDGNTVFFVPRSVQKNPVTKRGYGAGAGSVAGGFAHSVLKEIYAAIDQEMHDIGNGLEESRVWYDEMQEHFDILFGKGINAATLFNSTKVTKYARDFEFTQNQKDNFFKIMGADDTRNTIGKQGPTGVGSVIYDSTESLIGNLSNTTDTLLDAYSMLQKAASKRLKAEQDRYKEKGDKADEVFSKAEQDKLIAEINKEYGLEIETPFGNFNPSSRLKRVINSTMSNLKETVRAKLSEPGIDDDPGVSVLPLLVIGLGDAAVIKEFSKGTEGNAYTQHYDAIDAPADRHIFEEIQRLNEAFAKVTSTVNIPRYILNSFEKANKAGLLKEESINKFSVEGKYTVTPDMVQVNLRNLADQTDIVNAAMSDTEWSAQHYNISDERATYTNEGTGENVFGLDREYEGTQNIKTIHVKASTLVSKIKDRLKASKGEYSASQRALYESAFNVMTKQNKDFEVIYGDRTSLPRPLADVNKNRAAIDIVNNKIYIKADNTFDENTALDKFYSSLDDNLLHEIIHGLTMNTMYRHYAGETISSEASSAIVRLEKLSDRFRKFNPGEGNLSASQRDLVVELQDILSEVGREDKATPDTLIESTDKVVDGSSLTKASVLSEFVAHFLTNKELVGVGKRIPVPETLKKLARKVMDNIRSLWGIRTKNESLFEAIKFEFDIIIQESDGSPIGRSVEQNAGSGRSEARARSVFLFNTAYMNGKRAELFSKANSKLQRVFDSYQARTYNSDLTPDQNKSAGRAVAKQKKKELNDQAQIALNKYTAAGFTLGSKQNERIFKTLHVLYNSGLSDNTRSIIKLVEVFDHVGSQVKVKDFGQRKFNSLFKNQGTDAVAGFLALSQSSKEFREIVNNIELPAELKISDRTVDGYVNFVFNKLLNKLFNVMHGDPSKNAQFTTEVIDNIVENLIKVSDPGVVDRISRYPNNVLDVADEKISNILKKSGEISKIILEGSGLKGDDIENAFINTDNNLIRGLFREIAGSNTEIEPVLGLVQRIRSEVAAARQKDLTQVHRVLEDNFTKGISQDEKDALYETLIRADLVNFKDLKTMISVVNDDVALNNEIQRLVVKLSGLNTLYVIKAEQLADHIITGKVGNNLLRNANAIAKLMGEHSITDSAADALYDANPDLVPTIDRLVSLLTIKGKQGDLQLLRDLIKRDRKGLEKNFNFGARLFREENKKRNINRQDLVSYNATKGSGPQEANNGQHVIIAPLSRLEHLTSVGYDVLRTYYDPIAREEFAEYHSDYSKYTPFIEGAMQIINTNIIHNTDATSGVDTSNHNISGASISPREGRAVQALFRKPNTGNIDYVAIYRPDRSIQGYQRIIDPNKLTSSERAKYDSVVTKSDYLKVLGIWKGRLKEESLGEAFNEELVDNLKTLYENATDKSSYVNIADPSLKDATLRHVWERVPYKTKSYIEGVFGENQFFLRKDLVDNSLGYALPTLTDPFTGVSRLSEESQKFLRSAATLLLGKDAFKHLSNMNTLTIGVVKHTKETVIIRSLIVPYLNIMSDFVHLMSNGITPKEIYRNTKKVLVELDYYTKRQLEETELRIKAESASGSQKALLKSRILAIQDSYKKLTLYPLIEAGHFSTITEGLSETDRLAVSGKVGEYIGKKIDELPDGIKAVSRQALIARDTAIFKGMTRVIQYTTILSKSIYFEHAINNGMTIDEAKAAVAEEFVNYDLIPGRIRSFGDAFGLTWFFNYKLRILKVAKNLAVNHPVRAFMYSVLFPYASIMDAGGPIGDNILSVLADGRGDDAVGFWKVLRGVTLHPLSQLFGLN